MTSASQEVPAGSGDAIPREIWVLIASAFVIAVGFGLITPVLPQFAQSFGVGATASSIVVSTRSASSTPTRTRAGTCS